MAVGNPRVSLRASDTRCFSFMMRTAKPRRCRSFGPLRALFFVGFWSSCEPCLEAKGQGVSSPITCLNRTNGVFPHHLYPFKLHQAVQCSIPIWCNDCIQVPPPDKQLFLSATESWMISPMCRCQCLGVIAKVDCDSPLRSLNSTLCLRHIPGPF